MLENFFDEPLEQSKVKSQIVSKYFDAWSNIIKQHAETIYYVDLFAGQGYYEDNTESTPLLILKKAINNPEISHKLIAEFNDQDSGFIGSLKKVIENLHDIENLVHMPKFTNLSVSTELAKLYENHEHSFFFMDPWGYKGLSLDLIKVAIKGWASECLLFFNYDRINRDIQNPLMTDNINLLFGKSRASSLREKIHKMNPYKREQNIIQEFCKALKDKGGKFALPFCFLDRKRERTSHYLVHISKHERGYGLMKNIMELYSEKDDDGVPTFTYNPKKIKQLQLNFSRPLKELTEELLKEYAGKTLSVKNIYEKHQSKTRFTQKNYKTALIKLEKESKIIVDKPASVRPRRDGKLTLGDNRVITFS